MMCLDTAISGPRLIRAWKRRHWIEHIPSDLVVDRGSADSERLTP